MATDIECATKLLRTGKAGFVLNLYTTLTYQHLSYSDMGGGGETRRSLHRAASLKNNVLKHVLNTFLESIVVYLHIAVHFCGSSYS